MKANLRIGRALAALVLAAAAPALVTCRAPGGESLLIIDGLALTSQTQCTLRPGQGAQSIRPYGVIDLLLTNTYWLYPHFRNMMQPLSQINGETAKSPQAEVHYITVQGAKVYLDSGELASAGLKGITPLDAGVSGTALANDAATLDKYLVDGVHEYVAAGAGPSVDGAVAVQVITPELGFILQKRMADLITRKTNPVQSPGIWVTTFVTLEGYTQDGNKVTSNEFAFPILTCWGCLVKHNNPVSSQDLPCIIGQDDGLDCPLCPALGDPNWSGHSKLGCPDCSQWPGT